MTTLSGGTQVRKGYYWNLRAWSVAHVERDGQALAGDATQLYWHVPALAVLLVAPLMGAAFLVFLPFIGFYLVAHAAARKLAALARGSAQELAATVAPPWQPGEAHLAGQRPEEGAAQEKKPASDALTEVEAEITRRREDK